MNAKEKYLENFLSLKKLKEKDSEREREREKRNYLFIYSLTKIKVSLCFTIQDQNLCFVSFHALKIKKSVLYNKKNLNEDILGLGTNQLALSHPKKFDIGYLLFEIP